ncbi:MAG: hypothetical protein GY854_32430 [Deltaproteobacteria bacterium]|nr:hypothetical protein [Deltaproteobacteria bacterium]
MATIYTGVESAWYLPGIYVNVDLGRGTPSAAALSRRVLLVGNRLDPDDDMLDEFYEPCSASESPRETEIESEYKDDYKNGYNSETNPIGTDNGKYYRIPSLRRAAQRFGYGSELYMMAKAAFKANRNVDLWGYVQPEGLFNHAESEIWISTLDSDDDDVIQDTKAGVIKIELLGRKCYVPVKDGEAAWEVAANIANAFNNQFRDLPYYCDVEGLTGSSSSSFDEFHYGEQLTFRAKHPGYIYEGVKCTIDVGSTCVTAPADFTFTGADDDDQYPDLSATVPLGAAFAQDSLLRTERFHYIVVPYNNDDNITALATFLSDQADPMVGLRQQGILGSNDDLAAKNSCVNPRVQMAWAPGHNYFPGELAAAVAGVRQKWEGSDPAVNLCLKPVKGIPMAEDVNLQTPTIKNEEIGKGITPIVPHEGNMVILRSVTTAVDHSTFPVFDTGKVTVSDFLADDIEIKMLARYKGFKLSPDTDIPLPSRVTTPSRIRMALLEWLRAAEAKGIICRVTEMAEQVQVEIDEDVPGRVNFEIPEDVVDIFAVGAGNIIQIG